MKQWKILMMAILVCGLAACSKAKGDEIVIGQYASMTGNTATFGQDSHDGVKMAVDEVNQSGGLKGKKVKLVLEDDQSKPEEAKAAVLKLIQRQGVVALIGEESSGRTLAAAPEAQKRRIPMISPYSTNPKVTEIGDYIFRACYIDPFQGEQMARFAMGDLHLKKFAILKDMKNDYSVGLAQFFAETIKKMGGEIVAEESYGEGDVEFRSQLTTIKTKAPEAVFVPGYYTEVGLIARQARELGITVPLLGGDGWDSPKVIEIGGKFLNNSYFSTAFSVDDPDFTVRQFVDRFKQRYGRVPSGVSAMGYDAARILLDAIKRAQTLDPTSIRDALAATKDFVSVTGKMTMGPDRNIRKRMAIIKVDGGRPTFYKAVNP